MKDLFGVNFTRPKLRAENLYIIKRTTNAPARLNETSCNTKASISNYYDKVELWCIRFEFVVWICIETPSGFRRF
ncbi:hypothetical protein SFRURICE_013138 [Spodoptera frugiperda]|nr:hypothetical protein SFRURICE_013138 [Spodoptera frugiperda]